MAKKRVLILMHYMELGGAESALLGLLQSVDPERVDVDVFIYSHRGELMEFMPTDKVRLLPEVEAYSLTEKPLSEVVKKGYCSLAVARLIGRWQTEWFTRCHKNSGRPCEGGTFFQQRATWHVLPKIQPQVEYDLAISFLTPHYFVLNNVRAKKKIGWIHTDYTRILIDVDAELKMWERLDYIASISEEVGNRFCEVFPSLKNKLVPIENILNASFIRRRAGQERVTLCDDPNEIALLTIGRFSPPKKMEEIPQICRKIRERGVNVKWFIIGYGSESIERVVRENIVAEGMQDDVKILGKQNNPYPYIQACNVYVQPSRYEGKSITVREAQILCKPVIITNYPTAKSQVQDGVDGVIVPLDVEECARQMAEFILDVEKRGRIVSYLRTHDYGNESEINKIYELLG
ncbi:MAG: glycosyltransferase [Bacteroidaceae bacterium]|nr:glycosyltransferase [Bacteroidaceae bacterium]